MSANPSIPTIPSTAAVLSGSNTQATAGSRESSEFEFVGNNGAGHGSSSANPALLQTEDSNQKKLETIRTNSDIPMDNADVLAKSGTETVDDEADVSKQR